MTAQPDKADLAELAAEAARQADAESAAHGPTDHQDATYGAHGSRSTR